MTDKCKHCTKGKQMIPCIYDDEGHMCHQYLKEIKCKWCCGIHTPLSEDWAI